MEAPSNRLLTIDISTLAPFNIFALPLLLVMKLNAATLSHITLAQPFPVLTLWSRRHVSLKGSPQELAVTETLASRFSSCNVLWCVLVQPFSPQAFLLLQSRRRCPIFKQDQHAPLSLSMSIRSPRVLDRYNWHSSVPWLALLWNRHALLLLLSKGCCLFSLRSSATASAQWTDCCPAWLPRLSEAGRSDK